MSLIARVFERGYSGSVTIEMSCGHNVDVGRDTFDNDAHRHPKGHWPCFECSARVSAAAARSTESDAEVMRRMVGA